MWRVRGSSLSRCSTDRPVSSGSRMSSSTASGRCCVASASLPRPVRHQAAVAELVGQVEQDGAKRGRPPPPARSGGAPAGARGRRRKAGSRAAAIVGGAAGGGRRAAVPEAGCCVARRFAAAAPCGQRAVFQRHDQREGAALARRAGHRDVPPSSGPGRARSTGPGPCRRSAGWWCRRPGGRPRRSLPAAIGLDADAAVAHLEARPPARPLRETCSDTLPRSVNLTAFASRLRRICSRRWRSCRPEVAGRIGARPAPEAAGPCAGQRLEHRLAGCQRTRRRQRHLGRTSSLPASTFAMSRMSLISVQQVVAGRIDRLRELDLLGGEVACGLSPAAWPGSASCSAACAARATCWPGTRTCSGWRAAVPVRPFLQRGLRRRSVALRSLQRLGACSTAARWSVPVRPAGFPGGLRFLQRARLLLQLLVGRAQFLLLHLQFLVQLLRGSVQHVLQAKKSSTLRPISCALSSPTSSPVRSVWAPRSQACRCRASPWVA
jgi:hypothetical protein